jgi:hypothetical protein
MLRDFSTIMAVLICMNVIAFFKYEKIEQEDGSFFYGPVIFELPSRIMNYLGYIQLITSISLLMGFCMNKINIILKSGWRNKVATNKEIYIQDVKHILDSIRPAYGDFKIKDLPLDAVRLLLLTEGPEYPAFWLDGTRSFCFAAVEFEYQWICLSFLM